MCDARQRGGHLMVRMTHTVFRGLTQGETLINKFWRCIPVWMFETWAITSLQGRCIHTDNDQHAVLLWSTTRPTCPTQNELALYYFNKCTHSEG